MIASLLYVAAALESVANSAGVAPVLKLSDGRDIPSLGIGTWLGFDREGKPAAVTDNEVEVAIEDAIDAGYRHVDTAAIYSTEEQVGRAVNKKIADGVVKREDLFITTKLWNNQHGKDQVVPALRESLKKLNLDYLDLYLIHWPVTTTAHGSLEGIEQIDYLETWEGMIEARNLGLTKSIGVSNFNVKQLDRLISLSPVKPAVLQVEINLNIQQPSLLAFCRAQNITVTGYTPFGSLFYSKAMPDSPPPRVDDPTVAKIAEKYKKTVPQIVLRYLVELGVIPIPKSVTSARIAENIDVFDFQLTQEERHLLRTYDTSFRTVPVKSWLHSAYYPFEKN